MKVSETRDPIAVQGEIITLERWQRKLKIPIYFERVHKGEVTVKFGEARYVMREGDVLDLSWELEP